MRRTRSFKSLLAAATLLLAPAAHAQLASESHDADATPKRKVTPEEIKRWMPVSERELNAPVEEFRELARRVAAGTTDTRMLRAYHRMVMRLVPFDFVPPADTRPRALAAREALARRTDLAPAPPASGCWAPLGPNNIPGRMTAIALHPTDADTVLAAGADGGVWRTTDLGQTWSALSDYQPTLSMGALAIDPVDPNVIYAGTGEGNYSGDALAGLGLLKSTDGGASWSLIPVPTTHFHKIVIDPADRTRVWAATRNGLFVSTDSGQTWTIVAGGLPAEDTNEIVISGRPPHNVMLAGVGHGWQLRVGAGLYRSTDSGQTWTLVPSFPATADNARLVVAQSASNPDRMYGSVTYTFDVPTGGNPKGIFRSDDEGATWTQVGAPANPCNTQCWYNFYMAVDAGDPNTLYIGGVSIYRSRDAGQTWARVNNTGGFETYVHVDQHFLHSPAPGVIWAGNDGGINVSNDQGATWSFVGERLETAQYYHLTTDPLDDTYAIGGTQDNGTHRFRSSTTWDQIWGGDGAYTAIDWQDNRIWYASNQNLNLVRSDDRGSGFVQAGGGIDGNDPRAFIAPFALDRSNPSTVFAGTNRLWKSTDRGASFTAISTALATNYITAMDNCRDQPATIWVGGRDGEVWLTSDGGTIWSDVRAGLPTRSITSIAAHPNLPGTAYLSLGGTGTGHVYKTTDGGLTWSDASAGLPDIHFNHVMITLDQPQTLLAGADLGIYRSDDGAATWTVYGVDLPNVAVDWIGYSELTGTVRVGTHGRGAWQIVPPNTCPLGPDFNGLEAIALVDSSGTCKPELSWQVARETCPLASGLSYNVYRSTDPLFTPNSGSLLAAGVPGPTYRDLSAANGVPYYYIVKAEDAQTGLPGPANGGKEDPNQFVLFIELGDPFAAATLADDGGDTSLWLSSNYWSVDDQQNSTPAGRFAYHSVRRGSRFHGSDLCVTVETPDMVLGAGATLAYQASYNLEADWDGAAVEVSTDRGTTWTDLPPAGGYGGGISQTQGNGCGFPATRPMFNGPAGNAAPTPFARYTSDLAAYVGQTARIRWILTTDPAVEFEGFFLDDVQVTNATAPPGGRCPTCIGGAPPVTPNRLFLAEGGSGILAVWTSPVTQGSWNLHSTTDRTAIAALWGDMGSLLAAVPAKAYTTALPAPALVFYQVYGADRCTGASVP